MGIVYILLHAGDFFVDHAFCLKHVVHIMIIHFVRNMYDTLHCTVGAPVNGN